MNIALMHVDGCKEGATYLIKVDILDGGAVESGKRARFLVAVSRGGL